MANHESFSPKTAEKQASPELEKLHHEQRERIQQQLERSGEHIKENGLESARHEALDAASMHERETAPSERQPSPAERRSGPVTKQQRDASFNTTMSEARSHMSVPSRLFSKAIHAKPVEKTSEFVGSTLARPNALLSGAVFAFLITLGVYLIAKNIGYPLSGFESIGAFILGWIIGLAYDFIKAMITGRR